MKVTISGGFHNAPNITIRPKVGPNGEIILSAGQASRIYRHMCGIKGCICGPRHGWEIEGASRYEFLDALMRAI